MDRKIQTIFAAEASAGRRIVVTVLTKIERAPFGAPTPEEITHDQIAKQHFLKYCDGVKCIRGSAHSLKANWHNGFCTECAFNPYNMAAESALQNKLYKNDADNADLEGYKI